ncbi:macrophage mannose receptor 1-like [Uloborus diversus]|uniref:macrophage mannose receptor 1-like n=1 Tax=Uloborus diversus TaxID=327109 RepID=UPI00240996EB|nr:macrophage mannose receptor 1-like [Uloborus diversus]
MLKDITDKIWIGISIKESNVQKWSSGWFAGYTGWRRNKEDFTDGTCAARVKSETWSTDICTRKYAFVCESSTDVPPSLTPSVKEASCREEPDGWKDLGGDMCYFFETEKDVTWYEASFICLQKGGTLASIHSQAEVDVLHQFVLYTKNELHVGLHRKVQGGNEFVWSDHTPFDFKNWDSGEPNRDIESCSVIYTSHMKFHNYMCDERRGFICSAKKVIPTNGTNESLAETHESAEDCASGVAVPAVIGFVAAELCILCLLGIVLCWYFKPRCTERRAPDSCDVQNLSEFHKSSRYNDQVSRCVVQPQIYNQPSFG